MRPYKLLTVLGMMVGAPDAGDAQVLPVCRAADSTSALLISELGRYTSDTTGGNRAVRDSLKLPVLAANQLVLVTSESVCKKAKNAYQNDRAGTGGSGFTGRVYVVKIDTRYAVLDPGFNYGEPGNWTVLILDSHYQKLAVY
jgi:hypothetical protein